MSDQKWRVEYNNTDDRWVITDETGAVRFKGTTENALTTLAFRLQEHDALREAVQEHGETLEEIKRQLYGVSSEKVIVNNAEATDSED